MLEKFKLAVSSIALACLVACGGGDGSLPTSDSTDTGTDGETGSDVETGVSYYPLNLLHSYENYGFSEAVFIMGASTPFIWEYSLIPINSKTLAPVSTAKASDYLLAEDDYAVDPTEAFPMLQRVVAAPVTLLTAIVVDMSDSMYAVNRASLITSIKNYITAAKASSDPAISGQYFTVWGFRTEVKEYTDGLTSNQTTINSALDSLKTDWDNNALAGFSNINQAIVQAIGSFNGTAANEQTYDFTQTGPDASSTGTNDLVDFVGKNAIVLGNVLLFSKGTNVAGDFSEENLKEAVTWQSLVIYNTASTGDDDKTTLLGKPIYYMLASDDSADADSGVKANSEKIITIGDAGTTAFSTNLIAAQIAGVDRRFNRTNQYVLRYASSLRYGKHVFSLSSQTNGYSYSLSGDVEYLDISNLLIGHPSQELSSLVEITGPNGEYLSAATVSVADLTKLCPATRWVNTTYAASAYSWTVNSVGRTAGSDGCITISSADAGQNVVLTNTTRSETATVSVTN